MRLWAWFPVAFYSNFARDVLVGHQPLLHAFSRNVSQDFYICENAIRAAPSWVHPEYQKKEEKYMNTHFEGSTADKLGFLNKHHPSAHENILRVVDAAYTRYLVSHAEQSFFAGGTTDYVCYGVLVDYEDEVAEYMKMFHIGTALYYLYVRRDYRYAFVYAVNRDWRIIARRHLYSEKEIKNLLFTFKTRIARCAPGDIVCEIDAETNQTTIMKGSVLHVVQL